VQYHWLFLVAALVLAVRYTRGFVVMNSDVISQRIPYSLAASGSSANLLAGLNLQYLGVASKVTLWACAKLAAALDTFSLAWSRGAQNGTWVPSGSPLNVNPNGPSQLDDLIGTFFAPAGANLTLAVVADATTGTHTGVFSFQVES
jgi:hypothetical protein